jgi:flagellar basal body P-ring formation protein FlgA
MKQASNSLLIPHTIPFMAMLGLSSLPRDNSERQTRRLIPFIIRREGCKHYSSVSLVSCSPRSFVRSRLGEERIRSLFQGLFGLLLFFCLSISIGIGSTNIAKYSIDLKPDATVQSDVILLKDVAELTGPDSTRIRQLGLIELGASPAFGSVRTLSRYQIAEAVQKTAGLLPAEGITGAATTQIKFQGNPVNPNEIMELLKSYLVNMGNWNQSDIQIDSLGNVNGIELPPGKCVLQISSSGLTLGRRNILAPIEIVQKGKTLRSFWVSAGVRIKADIVIAVKKVVSGDVITADAVSKTSVEITDLRTSYARNPETIVGKIARKAFYPGDLLTNDAVSEPFLVKHGDTVNLQLQRNGVILNSTVQAEQDGRLGQIIRVRNRDFSAVLKAQVTGRAQVVLQ